MELNKIHNEDCLSALTNINDNVFDIVIADPPYNIGKDFGNMAKLMIDMKFEENDEFEMF